MLRERNRIHWMAALVAAFFLISAPPFATSTAAGPKTVRTIAIWDFENNTIAGLAAITNVDYLTRAIPEMLLSHLRPLPRIKPVERVHLRQILEEQKLGSSHLADVDSRLRLGRMMGAQNMVFGQFIVIGPTVRIDARIIEVETGLTLAAKASSGPTEQVSALAEQLAAALAQKLGAAVSKMKKTGNHKTLAVWERYDQGIQLIDKGKLEEALTIFQDVLKANPDFESAEKQIVLVLEAMARQ